jgi:hypothetical protein
MRTAGACFRRRPGGTSLSKAFGLINRLSEDIDVTVFRSDLGDLATLEDFEPAECARHARMFFDRPDLDLAQAAPGTFALSPTPPMLERLERDYENLEQRLNRPGS